MVTGPHRPSMLPPSLGLSDSQHRPYTRSRHARFKTLNMAMRCSPSGSFSTRLSLLKTIVGRSVALNAAHLGNRDVLGLPLLAKAIQAALTLSARAWASGLVDVRRDSLMLSNANGISIVCGDFS